MCYKCFCSIVPPYVLSGLSKKGSATCKETLADLKSLRYKREMALVRLTKKPPLPGNGHRYVYDSQNTWELRKKLLRKEGDTVTKDNDANSVYDVVGFMRDYLLNFFDYNSLDNRGMDLILNIHYRDKYNNAIWDGDEMAFGDGDGEEFIGFANSIEVIAHELMHGVTQFLANLQYYSQSGALNEHFSDVFGTIIKQRMLNQTPQEADWLIGNEVIGPKFPGIALRSMSAPGTANAYDLQPDHIDNYYTGNDDNQGVHYNSGIPNKAFYLTTLELGTEASGLIWFETLRSLWATADFNDFFDKIMAVTESLIKNERIPEHSITVIENAFAEVGIKKKAF